MTATPDDEPPTDEEVRTAVFQLVGYRKGRALRVSDEALQDGLTKGCLRWYYTLVPTEYKVEGRTRKPIAWDRTLVIERQYLPREQGITTVWNEWCVRWGLGVMQVFTPLQLKERQDKGLPTQFEDVAEPDRPIREPRYVPGAEREEPEVERAIVAAAAEYDLDLGEPAPAGCEFCSAGPGQTCDAECACAECKKVRAMEAAMALSRSASAPVTGAPKPTPTREKAFWED